MDKKRSTTDCVVGTEKNNLKKRFLIESFSALPFCYNLMRENAADGSYVLDGVAQ